MGVYRTKGYDKHIHIKKVVSWYDATQYQTLFEPGNASYLLYRKISKTPFLKSNIRLFVLEDNIVIFVCVECSILEG